MEITKREIIASISILAIMLILGFIISEKISDNVKDSKAIYNKAIKIDDAELFEYAMDTNVGNAFVYGILKAVDPVSYPDVSGDYMYLEKVTERYTKHTRTYTTKDANGKTVTKTETYWSWDVIDRDSLKSKQVTFLGKEFSTSQFERLPGNNYIKTVNNLNNIRYLYYGVPSEMKCTIFSYLSNNNLQSSGIPIYKDMSISETVEYLDNDYRVLVFWFFWIIGTGVIIYTFYKSDNIWLHL